MAQTCDILMKHILNHINIFKKNMYTFPLKKQNKSWFPIQIVIVFSGFSIFSMGNEGLLPSAFKIAPSNVQPFVSLLNNLKPVMLLTSGHRSGEMNLA